MFDYDAELVRYQARLHEALDVGAGDRVLDIGCGTGQTTREAARAAIAGSAFGVDVSAPMVLRARRLAAQERVPNVRFAVADAQAHRFRAGRFSLGLSRFGTMFFADPVAAFGNIARALRPGARLVQLVWQGADRQEWHAAIRSALAGDAEPIPRPGSDPFALSDPVVLADVLTAAGFTAVDVADVREPIRYGPDAASACDAVLEFQLTQDLIAELDPAATERARERLWTVFDAHDSGDGVWFDSRAWLVTARRAGGG